MLVASESLKDQPVSISPELGLQGKPARPSFFSRGFWHQTHVRMLEQLPEPPNTELDRTQVLFSLLMMQMDTGLQVLLTCLHQFYASCLTFPYLFVTIFQYVIIFTIQVTNKNFLYLSTSQCSFLPWCICSVSLCTVHFKILPFLFYALNSESPVLVCALGGGVWASVFPPHVDYDLRKAVAIHAISATHGGSLWPKHVPQLSMTDSIMPSLCFILLTNIAWVTVSLF